MALSKNDIEIELLNKGFSLVDYNNYKNLNSTIIVKCSEGHEFETTMKQVRHINFKCPLCIGSVSTSDLLDGITIPEKQGYRIIGLDNATENIGISIFDDGQLVFYHLYHISGETYDRLVKNRQLLEDLFIKEWKPDYIMLEDIQLQNSIKAYKTFKLLAMLLGSSITSIHKSNIKFDIVSCVSWRNHFSIMAKDRASQKKASIAKVKAIYGLEVPDDIAEAILIGKYAVDKNSTKNIKKLF